MSVLELLEWCWCVVDVDGCRGGESGGESEFPRIVRVVLAYRRCGGMRVASEEESVLDLDFRVMLVCGGVDGCGRRLASEEESGSVLNLLEVWSDSIVSW